MVPLGGTLSIFKKDLLFYFWLVAEKSKVVEFSRHIFTDRRILLLINFYQFQEREPLAHLSLMDYGVGLPTVADKIDNHENCFKLFYGSHTYFFRTDSYYFFERFVHFFHVWIRYTLCPSPSINFLFHLQMGRFNLPSGNLPRLT